MEEHQRKVDLQSADDLHYLRANIEAAAQRKLDLHLPPQPGDDGADGGEPDAFRARVAQLVQQYIEATLRQALPSLAINGLDAPAALLDPATSSDTASAGEGGSSKPAAYEPYDDRLAARLRETHARLEAETTRVAQLRREAPAQAAAAWVAGLRGDLAACESAFEAARARAAAAASGTGGAARGALGDVQLPRTERVAGLWDQGRQELEGLRAVTEVVAHLERAKRAVHEVDGA